LLDWLKSDHLLKGEFCIIVEGYHPIANDSDEPTEGSINPQHLAKILSQHLGSRQVAEVLSQTGLLSKNQAYSLALEVKKSDDDII
jgi:16S rRNA (cytidine1402-2'-O)-methyltransferase